MTARLHSLPSSGDRLTHPPAAEATVLDLDAIRERFARYEALTDRMDADGRLPGMNAPTSARTIGLMASLVAADTGDLLGAVDTLAAALAALLRLDECPTTGPEYAEAVEQAHAALATVTPTTGGAA